MQTKTSYRPNYKSTLSPFHKQLQDKSFDYQNPKHPVHQEIVKNEGVFNFTAEVKQDKSTLALFKHINGLVAFICTLKRDGEVIGEGRGAAVLNQMNKFVERTVRYAFNASLIDAVVRSVKSLDTLHIISQAKDKPVPIENLYEAGVKSNEPITAKQKQYLQELLNTSNIENEEKEKWENSLDDFSKVEASNAINKFKQ